MINPAREPGRRLSGLRYSAYSTHHYNNQLICIAREISRLAGVPEPYRIQGWFCRSGLGLD